MGSKSSKAATPQELKQIVIIVDREIKDNGIPQKTNNPVYSSIKVRPLLLNMNLNL